jgi:hypothetical protein
MVVVNTPRGRKESVASLRARIVIGGFICAIGYGVLLLGASLFMRTWNSSAAEFQGFGSLALAGLAIWLFYRIRIVRLRADLKARMADSSGDYWNDSKSGNWLDDGVRNVVTAVQDLGLTFAAVLFCGAIVWFGVIASIYAKQPEVRRFALSLPITIAADTTVPNGTDVGQPAAGQKGAGQAAAGAQERSQPQKIPVAPNAVLVWNLQSDADPVPAGAPPILLGALLIVGFGIWFPTIELAQSKGAVALSEKLVAPVLSAALIALGASQQTDADRTSANKELTEQGLPPTIEVGQPPVSVYVQNPKTLSPGGDAYLTNSLADLNDNVQEVTNSVSLLGENTNELRDDANAVDNQLNNLSYALANPHSDRSDPNIAKLGSEVAQLQAKIDRANQLSRNSLDVSNSSLTNSKSVLAEVTADTQSVCAQTRPVAAQLTVQARAAADAENTYAAKWHFSTLLAGFGLKSDQEFAQLRAAHDAVSTTLAQVTGIRKAAHCEPWATSANLRLASDLATPHGPEPAAGSQERSP